MKQQSRKASQSLFVIILPGYIFKYRVYYKETLNVAQNSLIILSTGTSLIQLGHTGVLKASFFALIQCKISNPEQTVNSPHSFTMSDSERAFETVSVQWRWMKITGRECRAELLTAGVTIH